MRKVLALDRNLNKCEKDIKASSVLTDEFESMTTPPPFFALHSRSLAMSLILKQEISLTSLTSLYQLLSKCYNCSARKRKS